ncbi:YdcF family protein [Phenylobacterium sp.]|uniref:YdcF family protein n=1 Tax=Phenylobacterium sp. TaxID=1871053 RepID=UPI0027369422|nr:YdcF family protein [Phenylobacterium sp.]MDP3854299.1 YdcF family protein [Phenylobacterium sp.]
MATYLVIFGAAVRPDGQPSGSLQRRIEGALKASSDLDNCCFMPTGGLGKAGFVEAEVIGRILRAAGVPASRIVVEGQASDTLASVRLCHALLEARGDADEILVCTSGYHQPRCALLFAILGYRTRRPPMARDLPSLGPAKWLTYVAKEFISTPYDCILLLHTVAFRRLYRT